MATALPYMLLGPKLVLDDWWVLRNQHFSGVLAGAGHGQAFARPGAWVVFNVLFGVVGPHPAVLFAVQVALNLLVAQLLFTLLSSFVPWRWALAVTITWQVLPNHAAMDHWASTSNIVVALAMLLAGGLLLVRLGDHGWGIVATTTVFVVGALCYEAVIPVAAALVVAVPWLCGRRLRAPLVLGAWLSLAACGAWMLLHSWRGAPSHGWADLSLVYVGQFGDGLTRPGGAGHFLGIIAALGLVVASARLVLSDLRHRTGVAERLVIAGAAVVVLGSLPFVKFPVSVWGINDRANVVSAIGAALAWVGLAGMLAAWRYAVAIAVLLFGGLILPARLSRDRDWANAGRDATRLLTALRADFPPTSQPIVVGPAAINHRGVVALVSDWDTSAAYQLVTGDREVQARITPDADAFAAAGGQALRFDLPTWRRVGPG